MWKFNWVYYYKELFQLERSHYKIEGKKSEISFRLFIGATQAEIVISGGRGFLQN